MLGIDIGHGRGMSALGSRRYRPTGDDIAESSIRASMELGAFVMTRSPVAQLNAETSHVENADSHDE